PEKSNFLACRSRAAGLEKGMAAYKEGDMKKARDYFAKSVDITPYMAFRLIQALKAENIRYLVAPYEADAQLCFLSINELVDAVVSEDSDLIPYGCRKIIFKLDVMTGYGQEIRLESLHLCKDLDLKGFT